MPGHACLANALSTFDFRNRGSKKLNTHTHTSPLIHYNQSNSLLTRVGQNHICIYMYTVYIRSFWQGNHHIYGGHIRCIYTVLANPTYYPKLMERFTSLGKCNNGSNNGEHTHIAPPHPFSYTSTSTSTQTCRHLHARSCTDTQTQGYTHIHTHTHSHTCGGKRKSHSTLRGTLFRMAAQEAKVVGSYLYSCKCVCAQVIIKTCMKVCVCTCVCMRVCVYVRWLTCSMKTIIQKSNSLRSNGDGSCAGAWAQTMLRAL